MEKQILNYMAVYLFFILIEYTNQNIYIYCQIEAYEDFEYNLNDDYFIARANSFNKNHSSSQTTESVAQLLYEHYDDDRFVNKEVKTIRYVVSIEKLNNIFRHACFGVSISSDKILTTAQCMSVGFEDTCKPVEVNNNIRVVSNVMRFLEPEDNEIHGIKSIYIHPRCKFDREFNIWLVDFAFIQLKDNEHLTTNPLAVFPFPIYSLDQETLRDRYATLNQCKSFGFVNYLDSSGMVVTPIKGPKNLQGVKLQTEKQSDCEMNFCIVSNSCKHKLPQFKNKLCTSMKYTSSKGVLTWRNECFDTPVFLKDKISGNGSCINLANAWINDSGTPLICNGKVWGLLTTHPHSEFSPSLFTLIDPAVPFLPSAATKPPLVIFYHILFIVIL